MNKISFTLLNVVAFALLAFAIYLNFFYREKQYEYHPSHVQHVVNPAPDSLSISQSTANPK